MMKPYRRKYRGYWILVEKDGDTYTALLWISGHPEVKLFATQDAFSAGLAEAKAESRIDKVLSFGGVLD